MSKNFKLDEDKFEMMIIVLYCIVKPGMLRASRVSILSTFLALVERHSKAQPVERAAGATSLSPVRLPDYF